MFCAAPNSLSCISGHIQSISNCFTLSFVVFRVPYEIKGGEFYHKRLGNNLFLMKHEMLYYTITLTKHRFTLFIWPSVCGWYVVLLFNKVPTVANNSFQKLLKKILPRSVTIDFGIPYLLTTISIKPSATFFVVISHYWFWNPMLADHPFYKTPSHLFCHDDDDNKNNNNNNHNDNNNNDNKDNTLYRTILII